MTKDYSKIPEDLRDTYRMLEDDLVEIHARWIMFRQLFRTNELRIELLNESAASFFGTLLSLWARYIVLQICRITDHSKMSGRENLVIRQLHEKLEVPKYDELKAKLDTALAQVVTAREPLRKERNRRIAHNDKATMLGTHSSPLPGISPQNIDDALRAIGVFMNTFRVAFIGKDAKMSFDEPVMLDDANTLIYTLKCAAEYRERKRSDHSIRAMQNRFKDA